LFGFSVFDFNSEARKPEMNQEMRKAGKDVGARRWKLGVRRWKMALSPSWFHGWKGPYMSPVAVSGLSIQLRFAQDLIIGAFPGFCPPEAEIFL
jgi:hypothetical protein